jgi:thymidylate synthase (FAD)
VQVDLVSISQPRVAGLSSAEELIAYCARVSNPGNQSNFQTAPALLAYLVRNQHWSPFEMVSLTVKVSTTRDIARQILRHRSFSFQEFSQRYAQPDAFNPVLREARLQDPRNRQASIDASQDHGLQTWWAREQAAVASHAATVYSAAVGRGVAKEVARAVLPEGNTESSLYMAGTLRSWLHYVQLRTDVATQLEHRQVALAVQALLLVEFPSLSEVLAQKSACAQ